MQIHQAGRVHSVSNYRIFSRSIRDYLQLTKPRIVLLLVFTTVASMVVAAQGSPLVVTTLTGTILGGALAAAGASVLNQYIERDIDRQMARTKHRPLPSGRIVPVNALLFGFGLLVWAMLVLGLFVNWLAAGLAALGAVYYVVIYTLWLKRNTSLNIVIGGGAGAMPVLVGWAAATNSLSPEAFLLFAIIFFWTPPHTWALALYVNADYEHVGIPMMPVAHGPITTRWQILWYTLHLVALTLLPVFIGLLGLVYTSAALLLGIGLIYLSLKLLRQAAGQAALRLYKYSSLYLALLFLAMMIDRFFVTPV